METITKKTIKVELPDYEIIYTGADNEIVDEATLKKIRDMQNIELQIPNARFCRVQKSKIKPKIEIKDEPISGDEDNTFPQPKSIKSESDTWNAADSVTRKKVPVKPIKTKQRRKPTAASKKEKQKRPFKCDICKKTFATKFILKNHLKTHGEKAYKCIHCAWAFTMNGDKTKHEQYCKSNPQAIPLEERAIHKCDQCQRAFTKQSHLRTHLLIHTGRKDFKCDFCAKAFNVPSDKKRHELICKSNSNATTLEERVKFGCKKCKRFFLTKRSLEDHSLIHIETLEERAKWKCNECEKAFTLKSNLTRHQRSHTGVKPYSCSFCKTSFADSSCRKTHEKTCKFNLKALPLKERAIFKCFDCKKAFTTTDYLKRHQLSHSGAKAFKCSFCETAFNEPGLKKAHEKRCKSKLK